MKKLVSSHFFDVSVSSRSPGWRLLIWLNCFSRIRISNLENVHHYSSV